MRDFFQKVLTTIGVVMPQMLTAQDSCSIEIASKFITANSQTSPSWIYYAGLNTTYDDAYNYYGNQVRAGVLGGGQVVEVFTDHGAGAAFWVKGGHYDLSQLNLTPANEIVRQKMAGEENPQFRKIALDAIGDPTALPKILGISGIAYFPKDDPDVLSRLLTGTTDSLATNNASYALIIADANNVGMNNALKGVPGWKYIDHVIAGKGNTSLEGYPEENGPGFATNIWMYGV